MDVLIEIKRTATQPFGIGFKKSPKPPYCQVNKLSEGGAAKQGGKIQIGDLLLGINGKNVQHVEPDQLREIMTQYKNDLCLMIEVRRTVVQQTENHLTMNGDVRMNNLGCPSPEISDRSRSPSPGHSPNAQRRGRRSGAPVPALPDIEEGKTALPTPLIPLEVKRHSMTPEVKRRAPEIDRLKISKSTSLDLANLPQWRKSTSKMVTIENLLDGSEMVDRLHNQEIKYKDTGCSSTQCVGAHMNPKESQWKRPYAHPRTKEEIVPLAEDFIKQYYDSKKHALGNSYDEKFHARLSQVKGDIEKTGFFDPTYEELSFGARTAWRNAPRCVNRIVWRQLEVLDAREAQTPKEMFDAICHHIKYANNGGNLRSTITVFAPRKKKNADCRVWNSQVIRYAGYKNEDGSILGDPAGVEFTDVCIRLGWEPPPDRTAFDVLPVVLQAHGGEPEWFEIPQDIILETTISHPEYDWFEELGLKWYALPAVSCLLLDVGGIEFPGIPFSGWYMGTEIARDLGDANRYNMLKPVALKMGLNIQSYKLWKDRAMLEINVAVLHSFQKAHFSIADHHAATEGFMTHMKSETQTRGGCPADWVWIVPPISGSITPVFHQEMLLYHLSPSYQYQDDPWKHYSFKTNAGGRARSGSIGFKRVAMMIKSTVGMFRRFYDKRVKATILYATETGRAKHYASVVNDVFGRVFATKVMCMEDYNRANLEQEQMLVVVTSTFGSGDPPANGEMFGRYLLDLRNGSVSHGMLSAPTPRSHRMSTVVAPTREHLQTGKKDTTTTDFDRPLTQVKYAVFGLGSRAYPNFCTFAHTCDNLLKDLGAEQIYRCGEGDELCGQEESFQVWLKQCYVQACDTYSLDQSHNDADWEGYMMGYNRDDYRVKPYDNASPMRDVCSSLRAVHSKDVYPATLKMRKKLQPNHSDRSTVLVVLGMSGSRRLNYEPGDHVGIFPRNHSKNVSNLLDRLNPSINPDEPIYIESRRKSTAGENWVEERRMPVPVTLREALTYYLDIANPPSAQFLKLLAKQATRKTDIEDLNELAKGGDMYEDWKHERFPGLCDVMDQFASLKVDVSLLLQQLPLLQCRYYSISSSPKVHPDEVHATVAVVSFRKRNGMGPRHNGVCSTWLNRVEPGTTIPCFIRKAHAFHMPDDPRVPVIMVGPGTGIAPFRSFWQTRMHMRNEDLKIQLSMPSNVPKHQRKSTATKQQPRTRRQTDFIAPNLALLQAPARMSIDSRTALLPPSISTESTDQGEGSTGGMRMCRSISDVDDMDKEEIAKVLAKKQKEWGSLSLFFGCRRSDLDHIYKEDIKKAQVMGALNEVYVGLSREPGIPRTYVQHLLKQNADTVVRQLIEERGHFYVCGDISMAADVCRTLQSIFEENAAMSGEQARKLIESMKDNGFYHEDIFGVTFKHREVTTRVRTAAKKAWRVLVSAGDSNIATPSPMTPQTSLRSPMVGGASRPRHPLDFSNYSPPAMPVRKPKSPGMLKRPTVTVLNPQKATPIEAVERVFQSRPSAPQLTPPATKSSPNTFKETTPTMIGLNEKSILEPVTEKSPTEPTPKPVEPERSPEEPTPKPVEPERSPQVPTLVEDTNLLVASGSEVSGRTDGVVKREMAEEKKKARRIRTRSKVETVL